MQAEGTSPSSSQAPLPGGPRENVHRPSITEVMEEVSSLVSEEGKHYSGSQHSNSTAASDTNEEEKKKKKNSYANERKRVSLSLLSPFNKFSPQNRRQAKLKFSESEQAEIAKGPEPTAYELKMRKLACILDNMWFQVTLIVATFIALYGPDINIAAFGAESDIYMAWICVVITVVFAIEIIIQLLIPEPYFLRFYFFLDLVGTLSLIPDMVMLFSPRLQANADALTFAKAGRIVRVGTRSTQAVRLFKLVRVARIMRVFKIRFFSVLFNSKTPKGEKESKPHKLGLHLADQLGKRVIIGTITLMFVIPNLEVVVTDRSPSHGLTMIEIQSNISGWDSTACSETVNEYITQHNSSLLWVDVNGKSPVEKSKKDISLLYRPSAVVLYETDSKVSQALFTLEDSVTEEAMYNMILTTFIVALLGYSAFKFNEDVRSNVVEPIERTTRVIRKLATTLFVLSHEELNDEEIDLMESRFIERVVDQLNTFFSVESKARKSTIVKVTPGSIDDESPELPKQGNMSNPVREIIDSIPDDRVTELSSLSSLWKDQQGLQYFKVFLTSEFALESFSFLQAVDEYSDAWKNLKVAVGEIIKNFVDERALFQVNISNKERDEIVSAHTTGKLTPELFKRAHREIFVQLEKDNFSRFVKSDLANQLRALKKKKTKEFKLLGGSLMEEEKFSSRRSSTLGWIGGKRPSLQSINEDAT